MRKIRSVVLFGVFIAVMLPAQTEKRLFGEWVLSGGLVYMQTVSRPAEDGTVEFYGGSQSLNQSNLQDYVLNFKSDSTMTFTINYLPGTSHEREYAWEVKNDGYIQAVTDNPGDEFAERILICYLFVDQATALFTFTLVEADTCTVVNLVMLGRKNRS